MTRRSSPGLNAKRGLSSAKGGRNKAKTKKLTDGQLKKRVWKEYSIYIRTRGADAAGYNECCTCWTRKHWTELQAGHFIRGRLNANLFDERGTHPQCYSCNVGKQGNVITYFKFMMSKYGGAVIDEMLEQNIRTRKWLAGELQGLLDHYKALNTANPLVQTEKQRKSLRADGQE